MKQNGPLDGEHYQHIALQLTWGAQSGDTPVRLVVAGGSMEPALRRGDTIVVRRADLGALRRGDILVVRRQQELVTHRLVLVDRRGWHLKGDAVPSVDRPLPPEAVLGLVVARERGDLRVDLRRPLARLRGWLRGELALARLLLSDLRRRARGGAHV
jgi:hypothetical protein